MKEPWKIGDRVIVELPNKGLPYSPMQWYAGTISAIDIPCAPRGVKVDLDIKVNGVADCYATHNELLSEILLPASSSPVGTTGDQK